MPNNNKCKDCSVCLTFKLFVQNNLFIVIFINSVLKILFIFRQEGLLSDEEAQEVVRLLSPKDKPSGDGDWLSDGVSAPPSLLNESITTVDSSSHADLTSSHKAGSATASDIGKCNFFLF